MPFAHLRTRGLSPKASGKDLDIPSSYAAIEERAGPTGLISPTLRDAKYSGQQTLRDSFLTVMDQVLPWKDLLALIEQEPPYPLETMLRIHFLQQWYALSNLAAEEALRDMASMRRFAKIGKLADIPGEMAILSFSQLLEEDDLARKLCNHVDLHLSSRGWTLNRGSIVEATISAARHLPKNNAE